MKAVVKCVGQCAAAVVLMLPVAGFGLQTAHAGGKSPTPAYDVTLENLSIELYGLSLVYPKIDFKGANMPKAEIEKLFGTDIALADRITALRAFKADSVEIPHSNFSVRAGNLKLSGSCSGDRMEKIAGGKIGKYSTAGCIGQAFDKGASIATFNIGGGDIGDYNFVHFYRLWADKAGPDDKEAVALHGPGTFDGVTFSLTSPTIDIKAESGKVTLSEGMKAGLPSRPLKDIVAETISVIDYFKRPVAGPDEQTIQEIDRLKLAGKSVVAFLEKVRLGSSTVESFSFTETIKSPKEPTPLTTAVETGRMETKGFDWAIAGIRFTGGDVTGTIGSLSWNGYSLLPFLREFEKVLEIPNEQITSENSSAIGRAAGLRAGFAFFSNFGTLSLDGVELNAKGIARTASATVDGNSAGSVPETVDFTLKLKNYTLRAEKPFNVFPTVFRYSFENLQLPTIVLTLDGTAQSLRNYANLKKAGVERFNMSYALDLSWDANGKNLVVNEAMLADENFGSISLKGTIGNFTETMFTTDKTVLGLSALSLLAKDISLSVHDKSSGLERMFAISAEEDGVPPEQVRARMPAALATIPEPYASMSSIQTIKKAVLAFWQNPGKLSIAVKAKNGVGIGAADIVAARRDPKSLDSKLDVTATATK